MNQWGPPARASWTKTSALLAIALAISPAMAHVGSPDVFLEGRAGAYPLTVVVRPPSVVPGVAQVEVLVGAGAAPPSSLGAGAAAPSSIRIQPVTYATRDLGAPVPDTLRPSASDPRFFSGEVWFMASGSYNIRVIVEGPAGSGTLNVPVPSTAKSTKQMGAGLGALLAVLTAFLVVGAISMFGAAAREGQLAPGEQPQPGEQRRGRLALAGATVFCGALLWLGYLWWGAEANAYSRYIYKPLGMTPSVSPSGARTRLSLELKETGWLNRSTDDLIPDHGHLMHLFLVRYPEMDAFFHIHPDPAGAARYERALPPLPAGHYKLFAEVVHRSGFPETMVAEAALPAVTAGAFEGDDSGLATSGLVTTASNPVNISWERPAELVARKPLRLVFRITDPAGAPVTGLELYMGMAGHAVVARRDLAVFAHLHPIGSVSMASIAAFEARPASADPHAAHKSTPPLPPPTLAPEVSFPYGFPQPGPYRLWVQVKHRGRIVTQSFDCTVS